MSVEDKIAELVKSSSEESHSGEPKVVVHPRKSGWGCPWHPFQLIAWFFIIFFTCSHYGFLVFYIPGLWRIFGYLIPGAVLLTHVIFNFAATHVDAAEENVRKKFRSGRHTRPSFNSTRHKHVIENMYCNLCQVNVTAKAKHCRSCDKCVCDFDHHCLWLNNCIGRRNYRLFLGTVFSALVGTVLLLMINIAYFILFFAHRDSLRYNCPHPTNASACDPTLRVLGLAVPDPVFPTLTAILGALALLGVLLLGHLSLFHVYLLCKGMSTYDYISRVRVEKDTRKRKDQLAVGYHGRCSCLRRKLNRVQPTDEENCNGRKDDCSGRASDNDSVSLGSIHTDASDGMATFGRTPPPSDESAGSGGSPTDSQTGDQRLRNVTTWVYKEDGRNSNANNNAEKKEPVSILRKPTKKCKEPDTTTTDTPLVVSSATETVINMDVLSTDNSIAGVGQALSSGAVTMGHLQPAVSAACRVGGAHSEQEMSDYDDADTGCLAAMTAGYNDDEYAYECVRKTSAAEEEPGSTLAAMAGMWEPEEMPEVGPGLLKADLDRMSLTERTATPFHGIPHHESRSSSLELQPSLEKIENISSYGSLTGHDLARCPLPSPTPEPDIAGATTADRGTSPIQFPANYLLQELTLPELRDLSKGILRSPSPDDSDDEMKMELGHIPKKVSFEGPSTSGIMAPTYCPQSSHPLPPLAPSRALQRNRLLPPIHVQHCEEYVGSKDSLVSGSTNSLPLPDPRYHRKGLLPKLGASDLTLNRKGKATNKKKGKRKMEMSGTPEPQECDSSSNYGHSFPSYTAQGYVRCVPSDSGDSLSPVPRPASPTPIPEPKAFISPTPSLDLDAAVWWAGGGDQ